MYADYNAFKAAVEPHWQRYWDDNAWVESWAKWQNPETMDDYCRAAYDLYRTAANNQMPYTLLGGTGIRMCKNLISNFGVTAASGIQEEKTGRHVAAEQRARNQGKGVHTDADRNIIPPVPVTGGAILSEKKWTPLLNDALIIGAITAHKTFSLTLEPTEHDLFRKCGEDVLDIEVPKLQEILPHVTGRREAERLLKANYDYQEKHWKEFMNRNTGMFWGFGQGKDKQTNRKASFQLPRVLARELLGLAFFGYQPEFGQGELYFKPPKDNAPDPTFQAYVKGLNDIGFHEANRQTRIRLMSKISKFLFDDPRAVQLPQDRTYSERRVDARVRIPT
jgi:hypothetical protein